MTRMVQVHEFGGPEVMTIEAVELPTPQAHEVRIAVEAIGLNRAEALLRQNQYIETPEFPFKLGYDAAGTVEAVGPGVDSVAVGDRVLTIPTFSQAGFISFIRLASTRSRGAPKSRAFIWGEALTYLLAVMMIAYPFRALAM